MRKSRRTITNRILAATLVAGMLLVGMPLTSYAKEPGQQEVTEDISESFEKIEKEEIAGESIGVSKELEVYKESETVKTNLSDEVSETNREECGTNRTNREECGTNRTNREECGTNRTNREECGTDRTNPKEIAAGEDGNTEKNAPRDDISRDDASENDATLHYNYNATNGSGKNYATNGSEKNCATNGSEKNCATNGSEKNYVANGSEKNCATNGSEKNCATNGSEKNCAATDGGLDEYSSDVNLSNEQIADKEALVRDVQVVSEAVAGVDYAENQVIMLCDSEEEALRYALEYEKSTGHRFELVSFSYGVATYEISEERVPVGAAETLDAGSEGVSNAGSEGALSTGAVETLDAGEEGASNAGAAETLDAGSEGVSNARTAENLDAGATETANKRVIDTPCNEEYSESSIENADSKAKPDENGTLGLNDSINETGTLGSNDKINATGEQFDEIAQNSDTVEAAVTIAADTDNDLPAVTPNYYLRLDSVTDNESFTDKFLKKTVKSGDTEAPVNEYQYYHEVIGSKYVFDEMDELSKKGDAYAGPLNKDFLDNLSQIVVEVIDTGINENHEDFINPATGKSVIYHPEEFHSTPDGYNDTHGHGTNVAGIIGNTSNDKGGRGIASGVKVKPADIYSATATTKLSSNAAISALRAATMRRAAYNAGVRDNENAAAITSENICAVNLSVGTPNYNSIWQKVISDAVNEGIVIVASAGNDGSNNLNYPSAYDGVISVASVNAKGPKSQFSNYGRTVDVSAPGGDYSRNIDGVSLPEQYVYASGIGSSSAYKGMRGTSQASPMVAALVALIKAQNPEYSPAQIEQVIKGTAREYDTNDFVGAGMINVAAALGIPTGASDVSSDVPSGRIADGTGIHLRSEYASRGGAGYEGMIYYTLDGTVPDITANAASTRIYNVKDDTPIVLSKAENGDVVTVMARAYLFGNLGEVSSFVYRFDAPRMIIKSSTGTNKLAMGKTLKLTAVDEETGKTCAVRWVSGDTAQVSVDKNGNVKALARSGGSVTVTAISADGSHDDAKFDIAVTPMAIKVELKPLKETRSAGGEILVGLYDKNTIRLFINKEADGEIVKYDIATGEPYKENVLPVDKKYHVYPEGASQDVIFTSSNSKIATVSTSGIVTPIKSGTATITITAADGSKVFDTFKVKCECGISDMHLSSKSGKDYVISGQKFTPIITYNGGKSVPDNKSVKWKFTDDTIPTINDYATLNEKTGVVTVNRNCEVNFTGSSAPKIVAYSEYYGVTSSPLSVNIYPATGKIMPSENMTKLPEYVKGVYYLGKGDRVTVEQLFSATDKQSANGNPPRCIVATDFNAAVTVTSDNKNVVDVVKTNNAKYSLIARNPGSATVTVKADDGSGAYCKQKITVLNTLCVKCTGTGVLLPGKSLTYVPYLNGSTNIPSGLKIKWTISDGTECKGMIQGNQVVVSYKDGQTVSARKDIYLTAYLYNPERPKNATGEDVYICDMITSAKVTAVGAATQSVGIKVNGAAASELGSDTIGEKIKITPYSVPLEAIQEGYTYKSSNEKVAKLLRVDSSEYIEATGNGTCYITVTAGDGSKKSNRIKVTVAQKVTSLTLHTASGENSVAAGSRISLKAAINAGEGEKSADKTRAKVTYSIPAAADSAYASVNANGVLSAKSAGVDASGNPSKVTVRVLASADGVSDDIDIVIVPSIQAFTISEDAASRLKSVKLRTYLESGMSDPASCIYKADEVITSNDFNVKCNSTFKSLADAVSSGIVENWSAVSTNEKVARVEYVPAAGTTPEGYRIIPVAKGNAKIRVTLAGSGKKIDIPVSVATPLAGISIYAKSGAVSASSSSATMKAASSIRFGASAKAGASSSGIKYEFYGTPEEVATMKEYATLSTSGVLTAKKAATIGTQTRTVKVCAKATDIWSSVSNVYTVDILPGVVYISRLMAYPSTDAYNLASGCKVNMSATCNADATSKGIVWKIYDEGAADSNEGSSYATISTNGTVKANSGLTDKHVIEVAAVAKEGNPAPAKSTRVKITLYPAIKSLNTVSDSMPGINTVDIGEYLDLHVEAQGNTIGAPTCKNYRVTYTTGAAKVYLSKNPETDEYDGSRFMVYGLNKGMVTITVTALDGSNKSARYTVSVK